MGAPRAEITASLQQWSLGQQDALDRLLRTMFAELRRLAAAHLRHERRDHTLQATADRDWTMAKAWLYAELGRATP